jgi:hypothetical protein
VVLYRYILVLVEIMRGDQKDEMAGTNVTSQFPPVKLVNVKVRERVCLIWEPPSLLSCGRQRYLIKHVLTRTVGTS